MRWHRVYSAAGNQGRSSRRPPKPSSGGPRKAARRRGPAKQRRGAGEASGAAKERPGRAELGEVTSELADLHSHSSLVGWSVRLLGETGAQSGWCGRVETVSGDSSRGATLLRVLGHAANEGGEEEEVPLLLPLASEFIRRVDTQARMLYVQPPEGLLELSQRRILLRWLDPQLESIAQDMASEADRASGQRPRMPTQQHLAALGRNDLTSVIVAAGGFLEVALELNLRHRRKPAGYWDNLDTLDQEISRFIAANWMELYDVEEDNPYYYNQITGAVQVHEPELPTVDTSAEGGTVWVIHEDPSNRVMPSQREICSARRYDLHHAILYNGGYRTVARELHRPPSYPRARIQSLKELAKELQKIMEEEGLKGRVPPPSLLCELGMQHLLRDIYNLGGYPSVVERMNEELGLQVRSRRRAGHWDNVDHLCHELRKFMGLPATPPEPEDEPFDCYLPTHRQLIQAGRPDLRYGLQKHGQQKVAKLLRVKINPRGRPAKSDSN